MNRSNNTSASTYDCIVIGAGMAGLAFAVMATARGKRVLVVEQHYLPGGNFTAFKLGNYLFNVAFEWTGPGEAMQGILEELGVAAQYEFERIPEFKAIISPDLQDRLVIGSGRIDVETGLCKAFPEQQREIARFLDDCVTVTSGSAGTNAIVMRSGLKSVEAMLASYFKNPLLVHVLYSLIGVPGSKGVLLMYIVGAICTHQMWRPRHRDHRRLPSLLHQMIVRQGGKVAFRKTVTSILTEAKQVCGLVTADGAHYQADTIVATTDPVQLYSRLVKIGEMPPQVSDQVERTPGLSCFCVFLGLDRKSQELGIRHDNISLLEDNEQWQRFPEELRYSPLRVEVQSLHHEGLAPPGHASLCVWAALPISAYNFWGQGHECDVDQIDAASYAAAKAAAAEIVLTRLERAFPGIRACIAVCATATPFTFKRYTMSREGSVCGHSLANIAYLKTLPNTTHVQNLYHIGHWTTQSGIASAMQSGINLHRLLASRAWYAPA